MGKVDVDFFSGPKPVGIHHEPSEAMVADKAFLVQAARPDGLVYSRKIFAFLFNHSVQVGDLSDTSGIQFLCRMRLPHSIGCCHARFSVPSLWRQNAASIFVYASFLFIT